MAQLDFLTNFNFSPNMLSAYITEVYKVLEFLN